MNYTKEEQQQIDMELNRNCSFEGARKAMMYAGMENRYMQQHSNGKLWSLNKFCVCKWIDKRICTTVCVSSDRNALINICQEYFGKEFVFDEHFRTELHPTDLGDAYFHIEEMPVI